MARFGKSEINIYFSLSSMEDQAHIELGLVPPAYHLLLTRCVEVLQDAHAAIILAQVGNNKLFFPPCKANLEQNGDPEQDLHGHHDKLQTYRSHINHIHHGIPAHIVTTLRDSINQHINEVRKVLADVVECSVVAETVRNEYGGVPQPWWNLPLWRHTLWRDCRTMRSQL